MAWLPDGEKNFEDMFIRFDRMHKCDGHTDTDTHTHTQTPHDDIGHGCIASCGKNSAKYKNSVFKIQLIINNFD